MSDSDEDLRGRLADALRALDEAPCGLARTDSQGLFLQINATFCRWIGWECADLVGRKRLQDLFTVGGRIFHQTHWAPLLQMQGSVAEVKLEVLHRDGHSIPMVLNAIRREEGGTVVHHLATYLARDRDAYERELVLSRRRLEAAVADAERLQAEAKDRALFAEQMIGIVSHDLRNPLSTIHTGAELLARFGAGAQQQKVLDRILRANERAVRLIGDLLDFTRARLGTGLPVAPRSVSPHALVGESVDELRLAFPGRELRHRREGEGEVTADPHRIAQLLGNLVANAMTYGRRDAPVTVASEVDAERFTVSVHNEGTPIPEDFMPRLFLPLSRGEDHGGTSRSVGLGLFIVSEIAKAHHGRVHVHSREGEGTRFAVELPRHPPAAGITAPGEASG